MRFVRPATQSGSGIAYSRHATTAAVALAVVWSALVAVLTFGLWSPVVVAVATGVSALMVALALAKIGGIVGDVLGAVQQLASVSIMVTAVGVVDGGHPVPFWV